ncbi:MAG: response regulator transcription factor [Chloroflexi bacterium]|nr:response regulator transcription factor [Chloroflexota bacterium]MCI0795613.1 response regulator transcription factor [Chloroflexota bacterium]MCI0822517.1 response regulator transcription factor [Chloroflexota bacterium]MCI0841786.1 response regulator transcription factor [Chloroflexota bacterium]
MKVLFFSHDGDKVEQLGLALRLRWPDLRPLIASEGHVGLEVVEREEPDIVIICEDLPDMTVWEAIKEIRRFSDTPIIVALESDGEMEVVKALELGADEFIRLPCNLTEFMARSVAIIRRVGLTKQRSDETPIRCGDLLINPATYEVYLADSRLLLTPTEFKLLYLLAKNRHVTLTQEFIQRVIWSEDIEAGEALKKYIQRLRRKLGDDARNPTWIKTVHGVGYRFAATTAA